ncbi:LuxR C-terminal-related transcriptional regulator [Mycolicibacter sp. MYC017]|uniref:LuxR C-terminal-related transcriptional regulator n=2 Tax=Mycolicibacter TaxID=1073531 RepID=A0ABU5XKA3_9MYCO|nr:MULTISPECIES: LuxR family transcriptional regulator [unclassified Mycolicibacter]MEB3022624.1 LuxR C-terminal-related transcriptional regulator [Mycolicibacter sp. MYC098]MEB3070417.1 LuxR C-terminal-related transcriptional regulator [Mycolicibacter sp. MYC017]
MSRSAAACVGRDHELAELAGFLDAAATRGAAMVCITGPSGIGKTALLRRLTETHRGPVHSAQAMDWETDSPAGVLRQLLQESPPTEPVAAAAWLADRVTGDGPTLIVVDDAEFADPVSLKALSTLVRHRQSSAILVLLAMTTPTPLLAGFGTEEIRLTGLSPAAVADLARLRGRVLHPAMAELLTRHTRGNPRDVLALLDELPASSWAQPDARLPAPAHVTADVRVRLDHCSADTRALIEALAILDPDESLDAATQLAGLTDPLDAIDEGVAANLITMTADQRPHLCDPLTTAAVVAIMGVRAVAAAHHRAAEVVVDPARRLRHLVAATPTTDPQLADRVDQLAHDRSGAGAWAEAAGLYRDASRLTADPLLRDERLTRSVDALVAAGDCAGAATLVPVVESLRETPLRNAVLAYLAVLRGRAAEAEVRLQRAWDIVNAERDPATAALIAQRHVLNSLMRCRGDELVGWADRAIALAGDDSPAGLEAAAIRGLGLAASGRSREAAAGYDDLGARVRDGAQAQRVTMGRGWFQLSMDEVDGARSNLESAVAMAELGGSSRITLWALAWLARVQFTVGDWDRALDSARRGRELAAGTGIVLVTPLLAWTEAQVYALRGSWQAATAAVSAADAVTGDYELMRLPTLIARAGLAEAEADHATVRRVLEPLTKASWDPAQHEPALWPWVDMLAGALVSDGQLGAAEAFLGSHERFCRGHRSAQARLSAARGRLLGATGDLAAARRCFDEALALLDGLPMRYDLARINFAYGQTLRRAGKRRDADPIIRTARELYLSLGAQTFVDRCERELKAGGVHQLRGSRRNAELTPQEEAVTALVAQGLSNREVAAELYISAKTVQYHLTRIYAKLEVRSRSELAALRR